MPITQVRLQTLLTAAQDYQRALTEATQSVLEQVEAARQGRSTPAEALSFIHLLFDKEASMMLSHPGESPKVIALEAKHLRDHWRDNQRAAERQRKRRGTGGGTAPDSIEPPVVLPNSLYRDVEGLSEPIAARLSSKIPEARRKELDALVEEALAEPSAPSTHALSTIDQIVEEDPR